MIKFCKRRKRIINKLLIITIELFHDVILDLFISRQTTSASNVCVEKKERKRVREKNKQ
jgi:hypothetical protein